MEAVCVFEARAGSDLGVTCLLDGRFQAFFILPTEASFQLYSKLGRWPNLGC